MQIKGNNRSPWLTVISEKSSHLFWVSSTVNLFYSLKFIFDCCLQRRGDLVQEQHGDQPQAARAISSQTPMWWTANGVYWWVAQHYIAWVYSVTSVCLRHRLNAIGYPERIPVFPYSVRSSDHQALTIHIWHLFPLFMKRFKTSSPPPVISLCSLQLSDGHTYVKPITIACKERKKLLQPEDCCIHFRLVKGLCA